MGGLFLGDTVRGRVLIALRKGMLFGFPSSVLDFLHENYTNKSNPHPTQSIWLFLTVPSERTRKTKLWKAIYYILFILHTCVLRRWVHLCHCKCIDIKEKPGAGIDSFYHMSSGDQTQLVMFSSKLLYFLRCFTDLQVKILRILFSKTIVSIWSNRNVH